MSGVWQILSAIVVSLLTLLFMLLPATSPMVHGASRLLGGSELTDAFGHVALMAALTAAWRHALRSRLGGRNALLASIAIGLTVGTTTELAQTGIPDRGASLLDLGANALGVAIGALYLRTRNR